ncbi:hypothetical protein [Chryseobacterium sp. T1]
MDQDFLDYPQQHTYHTKQQLLDKNFRNYEEKDWKKRTFASSCLIYYLGFNKKINYNDL